MEVALNEAGLSLGDVSAIGISNQRETVIAWNEETGTPVAKAIVWACRRTADYCDRLKDEGFDDVIKEKTGLVTYGTGCFMVMNTGAEAISSPSGLLTTIAWQIGDELTYAPEGSVFIAGALMQWMRDDLNFFTDVAETEAMATAVPSTEGLYIACRPSWDWVPPIGIPTPVAP